MKNTISKKTVKTYINEKRDHEHQKSNKTEKQDNVPYRNGEMR